MSYCKSLKEFKLFDNQVSNVKALIQRRRALLSDKVGAGKTLSILTAFAYLYDNKKLENLLVFMPNSAYQKQVWQKDINKFTYLKCIDLETLVARYQGRFQNSDFENILKEYPIIICKHSHVRNYLPYLMIIANLPMTMVTCDECVTGDTLINVRGVDSDRSNAVRCRSIKYLVDNQIKCEVESLDEDGNIVWKPITHWFNNGAKEVWKFNVNTKFGVRTIKSTPDHLYNTSRGWVELQNLQVGDQLYTIQPHVFGKNSAVDIEYSINWERSKEILLGNLLGDSGFSFNKPNKKTGCQSPRFYIEHGKSQLDYLNQLKYCYGSLMKDRLGVNHCKDWGRERDIYRYNSITQSGCFDEIIKSLYRGQHKYVTREYLDQLTDLSIAVWYMDDGSFHGWRIVDGVRQKPSENYTGAISLSTHGFSYEENVTIQKYFKEVWDVNFDIKIDKRCNKYFLRSTDCKKFIDIVKPWVCKSLEYKLGWYGEAGDGLLSLTPASYTVTKTNTKVWNYSVPCGQHNVELATVTELPTYYGEECTYDIEVADTHNYVANSISIHNCHAFKNPKSDMTNKFRLVINHAQNRWFITGTTLSKNLEDTYNIINLLSPWFLGTFNNFRDTYCVCQEKIIGKKNGRLVVAKNIVGISNQEAFQARLEPLVITGESFFDLKFHWMDYTLSEPESNVYRKVAKGLDVQSEATAEQWMEYIMNNDVDVHPIKDVERYSSRFIYLQSCADGLLSDRGCIENNDNSTKVDLLEKTIDTIVAKKQSCIVYFDYLATVHIVESRLKARYGNKAQILLSTGENVLDGNAVTEQKCKNLPHIILGTKASSESVSYYFINNVIFFHIPTVPSVFIQTTGRITRKNSLYPDDLNVFIFRSNNIDLYKMYVVSSKTAQMEILQGHEGNVPDDYKQQSTDIGFLDTAKKALLWVK